MSDIFQEVDESLQQDRVLGFWNRFKYLIYALIAALIIGVAGYEIYKWQSARTSEKEATAFYEARTALLDNEDPAGAAQLFGQIAASDSAFAELSAHFLAEIQLVENEDEAAAIATLKTAAEGDGVFADAARLKAAYLMADDSDLATLESWLQPLTSEAGAPLGYLALEVIGSRAFSLGDYDVARQKYNAITMSLDVPANVEQRAQVALEVLNVLESVDGSSS